MTDNNICCLSSKSIMNHQRLI